MVTEDKTQITAPSGQQYGVGSHNEAYGSGLSCVRAMKPSGNEAPNTAADLAADGIIYIKNWRILPLLILELNMLNI